MQDPDRVTYFAATDSRGKRMPFGLKAKDRLRHMYVIGKTGMGKSTILENMAIQDIQNGEGMAFIDPHGSAVETLLNYIPPNRVNDVVYFAPFDMEHPLAFNVMEDVGYDKRHLVVSGLMATFKKIWEDAWSARMEYILTNTLLALLEYPDATLLGVNRMYTDKQYRDTVVANVKDPVVKQFWLKEFAGMTDRTIAEATPAIQNKIGQFTGNPLIRNIIGQPKSSFDIRELMDNKKILLINLSKGLVGDTNMRLLGSMLTTRIFLGAMSRAELAPTELKKAQPFYFYVDEFQNFANDTFAEILSEARKYSLGLIMAHQYLEQMEEQVAAAVFGNVGTTLSYRVGPLDAEKLEPLFMPNFTKDDLVNLGLYQMYLTLMIDGVGSAPFSAVGIPPIEPPTVSLREQVIAQSRAQFGGGRASVEGIIFSELEEPAKKPALPPGDRQDRTEYSDQNKRGEQGQRNDRSNGNSNDRSSGTTRQAPPVGQGSAVRRDSPQRRESAAGNDTRSEQRNESRSEQRNEQRSAERSRPAPRQQPQSDAPRERGASAQGQPAQQSASQREHVERPRASRTEAPERWREAPPAEGKSAEDLRNILRSMTQSAEAIGAANKPERDAAPLKEALKQVHAVPPASRPNASQQQSKPQSLPQPESASKEPSEQKPYEVPEETLRNIFKES